MSWINPKQEVLEKKELFIDIKKTTHNSLFFRNHAVDWWFRRRFARLPYGLKALFCFSEKDIRWLKVSNLPNLDYRPLYNKSSAVTRKITYGTMFFSWKFPTETSSWESAVRKRNCIFNLIFDDFTNQFLTTGIYMGDYVKFVKLKGFVFNVSEFNRFIIPLYKYLPNFTLNAIFIINNIFIKHDLMYKSRKANILLGCFHIRDIATFKIFNKDVFFTRRVIMGWDLYFPTISYYYFFKKKVFKVPSNLNFFFNFWYKLDQVMTF